MFKVLLKETSPVNITTFPLTVALPNASLNAAAEPTSTAPPLTEQSSPTIKTIQPINPLFLFILLSLYFLFRHARNVVSKFILGRKQVETPFILCFPRESSRKRCFLLLPERIVARNTVSRKQSRMRSLRNAVSKSAALTITAVQGVYSRFPPDMIPETLFPAIFNSLGFEKKSIIRQFFFHLPDR